MLIKELRIQGPDVPRMTQVVGTTRVLVRPGRSSQLMIRAQRQAGENKVASSKSILQGCNVEIWTFLRAATCTFTGEDVDLALDQLRKTAKQGGPDVVQALELLREPLKFVENLGATRR